MYDTYIGKSMKKSGNFSPGHQFSAGIEKFHTYIYNQIRRTVIESGRDIDNEIKEYFDCCERY